MHKQHIACGQCQKDLTVGVDYRLELSASTFVSSERFSNPKHKLAKPPFTDDRRFCNWKCLRDWVMSK